MVWCGAWFYISADTPTKHPRINKEERVYITSNMDYNTLKKVGFVTFGTFQYSFSYAFYNKTLCLFIHQTIVINQHFTFIIEKYIGTKTS